MTQLSMDQLHLFEERLRAAGATVVDAWLPGLSEDEIRSAFAIYPEVHLPVELITWWGWHGAVERSISRWGHFGGNINQFISPPDAAARYDWSRKEPDREQLVSWIEAQDPWKYVECEAASPLVGRVVVQHKADDPRQLLPSLGALVDLWTNFIDRGVWVYPPGQPPVTDIDAIADDDVLTWDAS